MILWLMSGLILLACLGMAWKTPSLPASEQGTEWMGVPIVDLDNKRLHNIVTAMERGTWKTTGYEVKIEAKMRGRLLDEYASRCDEGSFGAAEISTIEQANKSWEKKQ